MKTSVIGFPRIGVDRELKFATEKYFDGKITQEQLETKAKELRKIHWQMQAEAGIDFIPSNDFSFYDQMLDTAVMLGVIPKRYKELNVNKLDTYFAMARGYQKNGADEKALPMKKWFNTNYHYIVPEVEDAVQIVLSDTAVFDAYKEAKKQGIETKPSVIGPYTFLKLAHFIGKKGAEDFAEDVIDAYINILKQFNQLGAGIFAIEEPALVLDLTAEDIILFEKLYSRILSEKGRVNVWLQTYFGDIRDSYKNVMALDFDGVGLDFVEGRKTAEQVEINGVPDGKVLIAGVVNGKNIWRNNYKNALGTLKAIKGEVVIGTSCSLQHVPYTLDSEDLLSDEYKSHMAYAKEKLTELEELSRIAVANHPKDVQAYVENQAIFVGNRIGENQAVQGAVENLTDAMFERKPVFKVREQIQKERFQLPLLPTTTIGSFPQTREVKANRSKFKKGEITKQAYIDFYRGEIAKCVKLQEDIGLDVLVHGEFERNDMVEFFGERLDGFIFTKKAWVQSYGTRCVKPPIVWGDISRKEAMTVADIKYAQSLSDKPVKGMLTGPVTILNWSFPREDIALKTSVYQIALAIREEVLDLEANGIEIIQIDEAALREKLPLRRQDWHSEYLDWAIPSFRLVHSGVKAQTQIHTHMCYSEFSDIIYEIDAMDADVITFEASRSSLDILDAIKESGFKTQVGPGVYDIHSPRIPTVEEMEATVEALLKKIPKEKLWINPDCGLKTRKKAETVPSLGNMVLVAKKIRDKISQS